MTLSRLFSFFGKCVSDTSAGVLNASGSANVPFFGAACPLSSCGPQEVSAKAASVIGAAVRSRRLVSTM